MSIRLGGAPMAAVVSDRVLVWQAIGAAASLAYGYIEGRTWPKVIGYSLAAAAGVRIYQRHADVLSQLGARARGALPASSSVVRSPPPAPPSDPEIIN